MINDFHSIKRNSQISQIWFDKGLQCTWQHPWNIFLVRHSSTYCNKVTLRHVITLLMRFSFSCWQLIRFMYLFLIIFALTTPMKAHQWIKSYNQSHFHELFIHPANQSLKWRSLFINIDLPFLCFQPDKRDCQSVNSYCSHLHTTNIYNRSIWYEFCLSSRNKPSTRAPDNIWYDACHNYRNGSCF